jgi:N-acetylneuraminic acid mutarotase
VSGAAGAVVNGQFYVIDGSGPGGKPPPQVYDPVTNSWSYKAPDPIIRANTSVGAINNKIYVAEGWINADSNRPTTALRIFDPVSNTWGIGKSSLVPRGGAASAVINGKLYVVGGSKNGNKLQLNNLEIYDPVKDKWSSGAPMPVASAGSGAAPNGKFYVVVDLFVQQTLIPERCRYTIRRQTNGQAAALCQLRETE